MDSGCERNLDTRTQLSVDARRAIETVTSQMGLVPVGTFKYKIFKYPGDIDIFEELSACCTLTVAKLEAAEKIKNIIREVVKAKNMLYVDFKAGYDNRYKIYTGIINDNIEDYHPALIRRDIKNLGDAGLLTTHEVCYLLKLVTDVPNINDLIILNERLRDLWVVRWNAEEVLRGYKVLRGNYKLYLDNALAHGSIVKLDAIAYVDDRYVEVTNFFLIKALDKYGNAQILTEEIGEYKQSLLSDVHKYYDTNPLKSIKRLWMYLSFKGKLCELNKFNPLFSSKIALYSQILSDIEVAINILQPNPRMSGNYNPDLLFESLMNRFKLLEGTCPTDDKIAVENLKQLQECLQNTVNTMTYQWLRDRNLDIFSYI